MSVTDRKSKRYENVVRALRKDISGQITVGIHGDEGSAQHAGGMTVAELGEIHEFGLGVPPRSFIGSWFDEKESLFPRAIEAEMSAALRAGKPLHVAFRTLAVTFQGSVQKRIADGIAPENAPATIARKGSSTPLIDTGVLRSAILARYETDGTP